MSLFKIKRVTVVKFYFPWDTVEPIDFGGFTLHEEMAEVLWDNNYFDKIGKILKRFSVIDWDDETDQDDYIEVRFREDITSDALESEISIINSQLGNIFEEIVAKARENCQDVMCENCEDDDAAEGNCDRQKCPYITSGKPRSSSRGSIEDCWDANKPNGVGDYWQANGQPHPQEDRVIQESCWDARNEKKKDWSVW